jgi:hypothetical protein
MSGVQIRLHLFEAAPLSGTQKNDTMSTYNHDRVSSPYRPVALLQRWTFSGDAGGEHVCCLKFSIIILGP